MEVKKLIEKAQDGLKFLENRSNRDLEAIDKEIDRIVKHVKKVGKSFKDSFQKLVSEEKAKINKELENYETQLVNLQVHKEEADKALKELAEDESKKDDFKKLKLEHMKKLAVFSYELKRNLKSIQLKFPGIVLCQNETDEKLRKIKIGDLSFTCHFKNKRICFFGDANKVMEYNLNTRKWGMKTLHAPSDLLYYSAAVTLPNGDALIIGGGSSTVVYQYTNKGELIKRKSMNQVRKEHSAVILGKIVYVMGGYDGLIGAFLSSCEMYNCEANEEWKLFKPMLTSK